MVTDVLQAVTREGEGEDAGSSVTQEEVECQVANLIYAGHVKGYLSHKHGVAVLSKANAFPKLTASKS